MMKPKPSVIGSQNQEDYLNRNGGTIFLTFLLVVYFNVSRGYFTSSGPRILPVVG